MTAAIIPLSGLHGANLQSFREVCALVDGNIRRERAPLFDVRAESLMREVRALLTYARDVEEIDAECAASFGARAANKLQLSLHMAEYAR